jgi:hypothetical protein
VTGHAGVVGVVFERASGAIADASSFVEVSDGAGEAGGSVEAGLAGCMAVVAD